MNTDAKIKNSRGKILCLFRIARDMSIKELCKKYSDAFGVPLSVIIFFDEELTEHGYNYRKLLISILQKVELIDDAKDGEVF